MGITLLQVFQGILQQDGFVKNNGKIVRSQHGTGGHLGVFGRVKCAWRIGPAPLASLAVIASKHWWPPFVTAAVSS
ncbi:hypothetical protein [Ensifer adhaerens]|uniref:hypothetical protein n=1 Tax=Ensifer adhaerens TaxID=106592 RepID=UPI000CF036EA|nr:hypothetical protein [Ensifer adhaerens]